MSRLIRLPTETVATSILLVVVLVVGLATLRDYGITIDEFLFDDYGPKALDWYRSGFSDWPEFLQEDVPYYGPWFQMLTASVQALGFADRYDIRHALTFVVGLAGLAALLPLARLTIGPWAGFAAIMLCLITGNFYGHLFFSPNDVPFMAVMNWAVVAIVVMARREIPSWDSTICAGLLTGLAIATRPGGLMAQVFLVGAMLLCATEAMLSRKPLDVSLIIRIALRTCVAIVLGWLFAVALWPWLQTTDPLGDFVFAFRHFAKMGLNLTIAHWGTEYSTLALPWSYVPGELLARLPLAFVLLLAAALVFAVMSLWTLLSEAIRIARQDFRGAVAAFVLTLARERGILLVAAAAVAPILFVMVSGATLYDGIRHLLFTIPMLALLAAWALMRLMPLIRRAPIFAGAAAAGYVAAVVVTLIVLHPLQYVATNVLAGGTWWSHGRFDLDYWCVAATVALRRLEQRLARENVQSAAAAPLPPPRLLICIPWREHMVAPMFRRNFIVARDLRDADFVIATERSDCGIGDDGIVIDEVKRFGRVFARVLETKQRTAAAPLIAGP